MSRTTADREIIRSAPNLAQPYIVLSDGSLHPLEHPEISSSTLRGCAGGIRSSVNDMLKGCQAILPAATTGHPNGTDESKSAQSNILPNAAELFQSAKIINPGSMAAGNCCKGWVRQTTPATLGMISPNRNFSSPVLGKKSPAKLILSHNGDTRGYTSSLCLFPEEGAAIVALTNGTGMSDCTDFIMQVLAQSMFDFEPKNDYVVLAVDAAAAYRSRYYEKFEEALKRHRQVGTERPVRHDFVEEYTRSRFNSAIRLRVAEDGVYGIKIIINGHEGQAYCLITITSTHGPFNRTVRMMLQTRLF
ncbi:penicillin-binding protein, putative [Metarhizium acridum CQMa 102]|uniref:Penicillin-binding protein, putative n=1 Tax=Metarhizium acridum (strain CQMa 102) TaxID=655827 RepID=E9E8U6_METAQ|nr:penicillin-binding protein, putative [Metarhizium acridum CQMa 102]EFY87700.1 penicillin-binding protein, putative [Metarhizium acridum CQMa 102]